jgi:hypothetical protein
MRGKKAKKLRRELYSDAAQRERSYHYADARVIGHTRDKDGKPLKVLGKGHVINQGIRQLYQAVKRRLHEEGKV